MRTVDRFGKARRAPGDARRSVGKRGMLAGDLVEAVARFCFCGFDFERVLLGGSGEEAPHAVGLPRHCFHDLGQRGTFSPFDHRQDFRALAFGARHRGLGGFGGLPARLGFLLQRGLSFSALSGFLAPGRALLLAGLFLQGGLLRRDVRALFRNGSGCVGFCVGHVHSLCPFLRPVGA